MVLLIINLNQVLFAAEMPSFGGLCIDTFSARPSSAQKRVDDQAVNSLPKGTRAM